MGYTLRTKRYRLVAYLNYRNIEKNLIPELYDHPVILRHAASQRVPRDHSVLIEPVAETESEKK